MHVTLHAIPPLMLSELTCAIAAYQQSCRYCFCQFKLMLCAALLSRVELSMSWSLNRCVLSLCVHNDTSRSFSSSYHDISVSTLLIVMRHVALKASWIALMRYFSAHTWIHTLIICEIHTPNLIQRNVFQHCEQIRVYQTCQILERALNVLSWDVALTGTMLFSKVTVEWPFLNLTWYTRYTPHALCPIDLTL